MPSPTDPSNPHVHDVDLDVRGAIPAGLSGRLVGIDRDGVVHAVQVHGGRATYRGCRFRTDAVVQHLVVFGGSILAFGDDSPAYELSAEADSLRRVDLAGHGRSVTGQPKHDAATGELHLIAHNTDGGQSHVAVSAGAFTRHSRPVPDCPSRIQDLALSSNHAVFVADGVVGVTPRDGQHRATWIATGVAAPQPLHAHEVGDTIVMLALTPLLGRWTLHPATGDIRREVLDPTPRRFARCSREGVGGSPHWVWTTGNGTIGHHDLVNSRYSHHSLSPARPGDFEFVSDATRLGDADGGWLIGFVHDPSRRATEVRVIDAADIGGQPLATVPIPARVPPGLHCTWIPDNPQ